MEPHQRQQPGRKKDPVSTPTGNAKRGTKRNTGSHQAFNPIKTRRRNSNRLGQPSFPSSGKASQSKTRRNPLFNRHLVQHHGHRPEARQPQHRSPPPRNDPGSPQRQLIKPPST